LLFIAHVLLARPAPGLRLLVRKARISLVVPESGKNDGTEESDLAQIPRRAPGTPNQRIPFT
jgi:hypothetical protein